MARAKHKAEWTPAAAMPAQPAPRVLDPQATMAMASPARALQQMLDARTQAAPEVDMWSRRRQVAFILTSACALWMAILAAGAQVVRAIA